MAEHGEVMRRGNDITEVQQRLLCHGEVYEIRLEPVDLPRKSYLIKGVERELLEPTRGGLEVRVGHLPVVIWLNQDCIGVFGVDILEVLDQSIGVTTGTCPPDAGINDNMHTSIIE